MGGSIGFTIREKNGREHRMSRWTNSFPFFLNNVKFIEEDEAHLREYLQVWYGMVEAYASGDLTEAPMADAYVPGACLRPDQYGLILVDYPSHTVLTCQSYSHVGAIDPSGVALAMMANEGKMHPVREHDKAELKRYEALFSTGRVNKTASFVAGVGFEEADAVGLTMEKFSESAGMRLGRRYEYAILDMSPWKVVQFREDAAGYEKMRDEVRALGFALTQQEETAWQEWIDEKRSYEKPIEP